MDNKQIENKRQIGTEKEVMAIKYLQDKNYFIITSNYRIKQAEVDIIARDKDVIVFIEVKYRKNEDCGHPFEAVDIKKQKRICKAALDYMTKNKISIYNTKIRFDVIGILGKEIMHVEDAFEYIRG